MVEPMATVINDTEHIEVDAQLGERWTMEPREFERLTGWTLKPEGLCRADVCAPLYQRDRVVMPDGRIDLAGAAPAMGLTAVVDPGRGVAALTPSASTRASEMVSLEAPDFTLPDRDGVPTSLHEHAGRKVLLVAWASW
jgi:hypothetical protein